MDLCLAGERNAWFSYFIKSVKSVSLSSTDDSPSISVMSTMMTPPEGLHAFSWVCSALLAGGCVVVWRGRRRGGLIRLVVEAQGPTIYRNEMPVGTTAKVTITKVKTTTAFNSDARKSFKLCGVNR